MLAEYFHHLHYYTSITSQDAVLELWVSYFPQFIDRKKYREHTDFQKPLKNL